MRFFYNHLNTAMRFLSQIFDVVTHSLCTIAYSHHEIHEEDAFFIKEVLDIPAGNYLDIRFTTPAVSSPQKRMHFETFFSMDGELEWWFYCNAVIVTAGTDLVAVNRYDGSTNTSQTQASDYILNTSLVNADADTTISGAIILAHGKSGSGRTSGGEGSSRKEMVLAPNTTYSLRFFNDQATTVYVDFLKDWYEHADSTW